MDEKLSKMDKIVNQAVNHAIEELEFKNILQTLLDKQTDEIFKRLSEQESSKKNQDFEAIILQLKTEIEVLKCQLAEKNNQIEESQRNNKNLSDLLHEKEDLSRALQKEKDESCLLVEGLRSKNTELSEKYESILSYINPYKQIINAFECFSKISADTKLLLKNIYVANDFNTFVAASMQWENLEGIWNFIRRKVIEEDEKDLENLHRMFVILFEIYNSQNVEPNYRLISPTIGSKYDSDKNVIMGTKTDGYVEKVLLEGIENSKTKKLIGKAIILV